MTMIAAYFGFWYSALARWRTGMSGSASFHKVGSLVPLLISRTGGFPNSRLYSRLNCEGLHSRRNGLPFQHLFVRFAGCFVPHEDEVAFDIAADSCPLCCETIDENRRCSCLPAVPGHRFETPRKSGSSTTRWRLQSAGVDCRLCHACRMTLLSSSSKRNRISRLVIGASTGTANRGLQQPRQA